MDGSRDDDLRRLREVFTNTAKPMEVRATAYRGFSRIKAQLKDRKLTSMRHELINAVRANDMPHTQRMEHRLEEYSWRMGYAKPPTA